MVQVNYQWGHFEKEVGYSGVYDKFVEWSPSPYGGSVGIKIDIKNCSEKTIKYAGLYFVPFNTVGDKAADEVGVELTGPIYANGIKTDLMFDNAWFLNNIGDVSITRVWVEYTDGTEDSFDGEQIKSIEIPTTTTASGACYVATAVYGSYDCPEVWTLRRYRDNALAGTWYGRAFIKTYYAISPTLVKLFGNTTWFKKMWQSKLDRIVEDLQSKGFESTPYKDKKW